MIIKGKRLIVRSIEESDLKNIQELWNNGEVMKWVNFPNGLDISLEQLKKWFIRISENSNTNEFIVIDEENLFCGEVFYEKDIEHKRAGLDIKFLPKCQGRGLASEALQMLIDYIFNTEKEIQAVWTEPSSKNKAARKLYSKCGLREKERPKDMEPEESYWELTKEEWKSKNINNFTGRDNK